MTRVIEITITPAGKTTVETKGFAGPACLDASRAIEKALGQADNEQQTAEFHQAIDSQAVQRQSL